MSNICTCGKAKKKLKPLSNEVIERLNAFIAFYGDVQEGNQEAQDAYRPLTQDLTAVRERELNGINHDVAGCVSEAVKTAICDKISDWINFSKAMKAKAVYKNKIAETWSMMGLGEYYMRCELEEEQRRAKNCPFCSRNGASSSASVAAPKDSVNGDSSSAPATTAPKKTGDDASSSASVAAPKGSVNGDSSSAPATTAPKKTGDDASSSASAAQPKDKGP